MAKKKRTAALFDVIGQSKRYQRPATVKAGGGPSWWPFGRRRLGAPLVSAAAINTPMTAQVAAEPSRMAPPQPAPLIPVHREALTESQESYALPYRRTEPEPAPARPAPVPLPTVEDPLHRSLDVAVDPERKVIAFRMNYTVAIVGGFALVVAVGLAVVVGQHLRGEAAPLLTPSIQKLQAGPVQAGVLIPAKRTTVTAGYAGASGGETTSPASQQTARNGKPKPTFNEPRENNFVIDGKRQIGLNYVVIQMYAATEEKMAQEASDFLNKNGVSCTIEKGIKGWPPSAFVVVGTKGFDRISTREFTTYVGQIESLSNQFTTPANGDKRPAPGKSYKAFQPSPKKWDKLG